MSTVQPPYGFLGESVETCLFMVGSGAFGFLTGGLGGAFGGALAAKTFVSYRWSNAHSEDAAQKTHNFTVNFLALISFAVLSFVGFGVFWISKIFSCAEDSNSTRCNLDVLFAKICSATALAFASAAVYVWGSSRTKQK